MLRTVCFSSEPHQHGTGDVNRAVGTNDYANGKYERKAVDALAANTVQDQSHQPRRQTGEQRARECLVDAVVQQRPV
jgi:hypothetical protein